MAFKPHIECECSTCTDQPLLDDLEGELLEAWAEYLGGCWTRERPEVPGTYPVATLEGHHTGYRELSLRGGQILGAGVWRGWWWSVRLPSPPKEAPHDEA